MLEYIDITLQVYLNGLWASLRFGRRTSEAMKAEELTLETTSGLISFGARVSEFREARSPLLRYFSASPPLSTL